MLFFKDSTHLQTLTVQASFPKTSHPDPARAWKTKQEKSPALLSLRHCQYPSKVSAHPLFRDCSALPHKQSCAYRSSSAGAFSLHFLNNHSVPLLLVGSHAAVLQKENDRRKGSILLTNIVTIVVVAACSELITSSGAMSQGADALHKQSGKISRFIMRSEVCNTGCAESSL